MLFRSEKSIDSLKNDELKNKLEDLDIIYNKFNESIEENSIDSDDELTILAEKLNICSLYDGAEIWIDEFTTFTPQQMEIIKNLAKRCKTINITLCMDEIENKVDKDITDIFNAIRSTENRILKMVTDNNIRYMEAINLNKNKKNRFINSKELQHIEKDFFSYPLRVYKEEINDIKLYKANNLYDEVENIAREILILVRDKNYRYRDISVICRNIDTYEKIVSVVFEEYNIPCFIDKKIGILNNPLIILILSSLDRKSTRLNSSH